MDHSAFVLTNILLLFFFVSHSLPSLKDDEINLERSALLAFKKGIVNDPQHALSNWTESTGICMWDGIVCDNGRVMGLNLSGKDLQGTISPYLSNLSQVRWIDLSENSLHGPIPEELGALSMLQEFSIRLNAVQRQVPHSLGMLKELLYIDLSGNELHGRLPTTLLYNCTSLSSVDLSNNSFTGLIPPEIGNHLPNLTTLDLYLNQLTGGIPASLCNSTLLETVDLGNNFLTGTLPSETIMCFPYLKVLHLAFNNFYSDDKNSNLNPFFSALSNLTQLFSLELEMNNIGGTLPETIGLLSRDLKYMNLRGNLIHGMIPPSISNLSNLSSLNLSDNYFTGIIPLKLFLLPNLQRLWLSNNSLGGEIPSPPCELNNLGLIDLSINNLTGSIPANLASLKQLTILILSENLLSGSIPSSLGSLKLQLLDLSHNRLTGTLPAEVAGMNSIAYYFNLSDNALEGSIPTALSKMNMVLEVDLSLNKFTGKIPTLEGCVAVEVVKLSNNHLQGTIPETLGRLLSIKKLDLSSNSLSGEVPSSLATSTSLQELNLSFNHFSGQLPRAGVFAYLSFQSIMGNNFCGSLPGLPSCYSKKNIKHTRTFLLLLVCIISVLAFLATILSVVCYKKIRRIVVSHRSEIDLNTPTQDLSSSYPRITYRELVEATGGFELSRLIGSGSYGHVYRGVLSDGSVVAIKVLQLQASNSTRSFNRECQVLKRIRHRNLMRIITACSLPDFKALVLPFMANGSLESHLYPQEPGTDFGIARLVMRVTERNQIPENVANSTANLLFGSVGYIAPEYGYGRNASTKGDVYSFGIIVLELVTRKRPTDEMFNEGQSLQNWVKNQYRSQLENIIDSFLLQELEAQNPEIRNIWKVAIVELVDLGLICTQEAPSTRPTMLDATDDLDRIKRYLGGDTTATLTSSYGISSSTITGGDYW
ncbi:hypothetical protein J5N97_003261 [Dioscorea zingiberensis]|uniref:Protein kinase domain-containing protein n=1 Tax=Dioscorea zingiberensis TaxID=325984 RepID=A0A9D5D3S6_9LILI|nr:hypothetical protein J5N97_003261 [Dioscorea zingiberensis]